MKNKTTIILALVVLVGGGLIWMASQSNQANEPVAVTSTSAALEAEVSQYDFGTININGGDVTTEFPVTNTGTEAIVIADGTTSCACTSAEIAGVGFDMHTGMKSEVTIAPGETKMVSATYDPLFHGPMGTGKISREVILKTNSVVTPEVRLRFNADVING